MFLLIFVRFVDGHMKSAMKGDEIFYGTIKTIVINMMYMPTFFNPEPALSYNTINCPRDRKVGIHIAFLEIGCDNISRGEFGGFKVIGWWFLGRVLFFG